MAVEDPRTQPRQTNESDPDPGERTHRRTSNIPVYLIVLLAFSLRLLFLFSQLGVNPILEYLMMDERMHDLWARSLMSGEGLGPGPFFRAPGYYGLLGLLYKVFGATPLVGRIFGCLLGAASVLLTVKIAQHIFDRRAAVIAGLMAAVYWPLIYFDIQLLSPSLEIFLNLLTLLFVLQARKKSSMVLFFAAGIALGLSVITRPTVLSFAPLLALWIFLPGISRKPWRERALRVLVLTAGTLLCVLPVSWYNVNHGGDFVLVATNGGVNFYIGNNARSNGMTAVVPGTRKGWQGGFEDTHRLAEQAAGHSLSEAEVSRYWYGRGRDWIRSYPLDWMRLTIKKFRLYWSPQEIGNNQVIWPIARMSFLMRMLKWAGFPLVALLAAGGIVLLGRPNRDRVLLMVFAASSLATVVVFFCNARYRLPIIPVLILMAAGGLVRARDYLLEGRWKNILPALAALVFMGFFLGTNPPEAGGFRRDSEANHALQLALYFSEQGVVCPEELQNAEHFFRKTLRLWPGYPEAEIGLAKILTKGGRYSEANESLRNGLARHPDHVEMLGALASGYARSGETSRAVVILERIVSLRRDDALSLTNLGCLQVAIGRRAAAGENLRRALELDPDLDEARICLSRATLETPEDPALGARTVLNQ